MRIAIIALILMFVIPAFAQEPLPLDDPYRFDEVSFEVPDGWSVFPGSGEYHIYSFEMLAAEYKFDELESGQVHMIVSIYDTTNPLFEKVHLQDYLMGYLSGSALTRMQISGVLTGDDVTFEFDGTAQAEGWTMIRVTSNMNDIVVLGQTADYIRMVLLVVPPGESFEWIATAQAIGATLTVTE